MAPVLISNIIPRPGQDDVSNDQAVSFSLTDSSGVSLSSTLVHVRGSIIWDGSSFSQGWTSSSNQANAGNGFDFRLVPDSSLAWEDGEVVEIHITTQDISSQSYTFAWEFIVSGEPFNASLWPMIVKGVRDLDGGEGGTIHGFLTLPGGLDDIWKDRLFERLSSLPDLLDPLTCPVEFLPYLRGLVGLTQDLSFQASESELRATLSGSPQMFNKKPAETSWDAAIGMVTGNRYRIRNFFDLRMASDWSYITELLENQDPHVLNFPSSTPSGSDLQWCTATSSYPCSHQFIIQDLPSDLFPSNVFRSESQYQWLEIIEWPPDPSFVGFYRIGYLDPGTVNGYLDHNGPSGPNMSGQGQWRLWGGNSEYLSEIRLVDGPAGTEPVNRDLLSFLLNLVRASNERIDVVYISFLDEFATPFDVGLWESLAGSANVPEPGGDLVLSSSDHMRVRDADSFAWEDRQVTVKAKGTNVFARLEIRFVYLNATNYYALDVDWNSGVVSLKKVDGGVGPTTLATTTVPSLSLGFYDTFRCYALEAASGQVRLRIYFNGDKILDHLDAPSSLSQVGSVSLYSSAGSCAVSTVEVMTLPVTVQRVGPLT